VRRFYTYYLVSESIVKGLQGAPELGRVHTLIVAAPFAITEDKMEIAVDRIGEAGERFY